MKTIDPNELFNIATGELGHVDGFFGVENGLYTVVLLGDRRWTTPKGYHKSKRATQCFEGRTVEDLAAALTEAGWDAPENLRTLCEQRPPRPMRRRKTGHG